MPTDHKNKNDHNKFWTIAVAVLTCSLQIFEGKRAVVLIFAFIVFGFAIILTLIYKAMRHSGGNKSGKTAPWREMYVEYSTLRQPNGSSAEGQEEYLEREQEYKALLTAGVIDRAEFNDRMAELGTVKH